MVIKQKKWVGYLPRMTVLGAVHLVPRNKITDVY